MFDFLGIKSAVEIDFLFAQLAAAENKNKSLKEELALSKSEFELLVKNMEADHEIALKKADAETENAVLEAKNVAMKEVIDVRKENAVLKAEAAIQGKMLDLNADVLDIKDLVGKLISALPKVNISGGLTVTAGEDK